MSIPPKRNGYNNTRLGEQLPSSFLCTMNCPDSQYEPSMVVSLTCLLLVYNSTANIPFFF